MYKMKGRSSGYAMSASAELHLADVCRNLDTTNALLDIYKSVRETEE